MAQLKRSTASLIGGIAVGLFVFVLVLLLAGAPSLPAVIVALLLASAVGAWVRLADL